MTRNLSIFLDLLRLFAALLVVIGHAGALYHIAMPDIIAHSAKEGVAIFFVLSGFVIGYVTSGKERDWRSFARARALRLYSVVPLALVVIISCYWVGVRLTPDIYLHEVGHAPDWPSMLRYLTFTNELWFDRVLVSTAAPFWSLGFEVAYYAGFAVLIYARGAWRWGLAALWLLAVGPRVALAFPLWLLGAGAWALVQRRRPVSTGMGIAILCGLATTALVLRRVYGSLASPLFEWPVAAALVPSMSYYLALCAVLAAAIVVFAATVGDRRFWPATAERAIRYCAGASFTLYIMHVPLMLLIAAIWPATIGSPMRSGAALAITTGLILILAELGERRKAAYARAFSMSFRVFTIGKRKTATAID